MSFVSDRRVPKFSEGSAIRLDFKAMDLQRIKRLAAVGAPRRVLRVIDEHHGGDISSSTDSDSRKESQDISGVPSQGETISSVQGSRANCAKNEVASVDTFELRKRKAERALADSRDCTRSAQMDGRPNPNTRAPLVLGLDLKKHVESVKELFAIQDKENVDPGSGCRRLESRKQAYGRSSGEKRRLQVSNKHLNALGQSKFGSVPLKQSTSIDESNISTPPDDGHQPSFLIRDNGSLEVRDDFPPKGLLQQVGCIDFPLSSKETEPTSTAQTSRSLSALSPIHQQTHNAVTNRCDSISVSQPVQLPAPKFIHSNKLSKEELPEVGLGMLVSLKQRVSVSSLEMPADAQVSTILVETSQTKVVSASIRELSYSMISLAISDSNSHEDSHLRSASGSEKAHLKEGSLHAKNFVLGPSGVGAQRDAQNVQGPEVDEVGHVMSMSGPLDGLYQKQAFTSASVATPVSPNRISPERQIEGLRQARYPHSCSGDVPPAESFPATFAAACSISGKTGLAPLTFFASRSQQIKGDNGQPSRKPRSSSPAEEDGKSSQGDGVRLASPKKQAHPFPGEGLSPFQAAMVENGMVKTGCDRISQGHILRAEGAVAKCTQHPQINDGPEKKASNEANVILQKRKRGETEHFVWVNGRRYQKLKKIGRGGSSDVYKVIDRDCTIYALKRIKLKGRDYATAFGFYQEIEYLNKLHGRAYIIQLIDHEVTDESIFRAGVDRSHIIKDDIHIYMVLEYGEIDLAHMVADKWKERSQGDKDPDETWLRFYWQQILEAVNTIHEERIVHSDLKPANFLLVKGVLKLIDFGIAKAIQSDTTNIERESQVGTLNYMSPEAFMMNEKDDHGQVVKCGRPSDIWSLGCILYQMVYGTTPFSHITSIYAKVQEVTNPNHKIKFSALSNPHLLDIMKKCLAWKRDERLRIPELLNHPFLQPHLAHPPYYPYSKRQKEDIISQIQRDHIQDRELNSMCAKLLERMRSLGLSIDKATDHS